MSLITTPSQTVGPFLRIGFAQLVVDALASPGIDGERITVAGRITDGDGRAVSDGVVEIWQADSRGAYARPNDQAADESGASGFRGFGRILTDRDGVFRFTTIRPGSVPGYGGVAQAAHLDVTIFMRGLLRHLYTRMYFADDARNATDPMLQLVPAERRLTLIAQRAASSAADGGEWQWNVVLQGCGETVFFDW